MIDFLQSAFVILALSLGLLIAMLLWGAVVWVVIDEVIGLFKAGFSKEEDDYEN